MGPGIGQVDFGAELNTAVGQAIPVAQSAHGAQTGVAAQQIFNNVKAPSSSQGVLPAAWGKIESIGKQAGHIASEGVQGLAHFGENMITAVPHLEVSAFNFGRDIANNSYNSKEETALTQQQQTLMNQYKGGVLSAKTYTQGLKELADAQTQLQKRVAANQTNVSHDSQGLIKGTVDTTSAVLTVMTGGTFLLAKGPEDFLANQVVNYLGSKEAEPVLAKGAEAVTNIVDKPGVFDKLPDTIKAPMVRTIAAIAQQPTSSATAVQLTRAAATNVLLKYPLVYNAFATSGEQVYNELDNKKYGSAVQSLAFDAALALSGGPVGWALKQGGKVGGSLMSGMFGQRSLLDEISKYVGNGDPLQLFNVIDKELQGGNESLVKNMIVTMDTNLKRSGGNIAEAAHAIVDHLEGPAAWGSLSTHTPEEVVKNLNDWSTAAQLAEEAKQGGKIKGMLANDPRTIAVGRWTAHDNQNVRDIFAQVVQSNPDAEGKDLQTLFTNAWSDYKDQNPNTAVANNENLDKQISTLITKFGGDHAKLNTAIQKVDAAFGVQGFPSSIGKRIAKLGYVPILPKSVSAPLVPFERSSGELLSAGKSESNYFLQASKPLPILGSVGAGLVKAGLSPENSGSLTQRIYSTNLQTGLEDIKGLAGDGDTLIKRLSNYANSPEGPKLIGKMPVTDLRQLTNGDIQRALKVDKATATQVRGALMDAMLQVPLTVRGLGDRIVDASYKDIPITAKYMRLQGSLRFSQNPFFQMRLAAKTEFLSQLEANGKFPTIGGANQIMAHIFPEYYKGLNVTVKTLEDAGVLKGGLGAEAANDSAAGVRGLTHELMPGQKLSLAGLTATMADHAGMNVEDYVKAFPNETADALKAIVQYDRRSNFINSPLARTLNVAFFPFRFNLKVSSIVAQSIGRMSAPVQFAVIKGFFQASTFLKSNEGQAWYSQNAAAIQVFEYFSPLEAIATVAATLGQKPESVAQYGELGGLPFGWIPGLLDASGLTNFNQPAVNPATGATYTQKIPTGLKGQANVAIQDFLGQLFTYPGATFGLPSKTSVLKTMADIVPGSKAEFKSETPTNLNTQQKNYQNVVQKLPGNQPTDTSTQARPKMTNFPATPQSSPNAPATPGTSPLTTPTPKTGATKAKKKTKAQMTPQLLPGQTQLGQL